MFLLDYGFLLVGVFVWCKVFFDFEGFFSFMFVIVSCFLGLYFGYVFVYYKEYNVRLKDWVFMFLILFVIGVFLYVLGKFFNELCSFLFLILNYVIVNGFVFFYDLKML